jgi:hypothetical protein
MKILNLIQVALCVFATVWLTTAAYSGWKAGPPPSKNPPASGRPYYGVAPYYGGSTYGSGSRSSGGSWGGGK